MSIEIMEVKTEMYSMGPSGTVQATIRILDDEKELFVTRYNVDGFDGFALTAEYPGPDCEYPEAIEDFGELEETADSRYAKVYKIADKVYKYIGKKIRV